MSLGISHVGLWITESCNLRCSYCFVNQHPKTLPLDIGKKTIDWLIKASGDAKQVSISFFGGEPLLELELIKKLVAYGESIKEKKVKFGITTNGTLLTKDVLDYCTKHNISILLSLDGKKETHDMFRRTKEGKGSFDLITMLRELPKVQTSAVARLTYTPENVDKLFENVKYIIEDLGYSNTAPTPVGDSSTKWSDETLEICSKEYFKMENWIKERVLQRKANPIPVTYLFKTIKNTMLKQPLLSPCGAARGYVGVSCDGEIYPCHRFTDWPEFNLGTVDSLELNNDIRKQFQDWNKSKTACKECKNFFCGGQCFASNYEESGAIEKYNHDICKINDYMQRTADNLIRFFRFDGYFHKQFKPVNNQNSNLQNRVKKLEGIVQSLSTDIRQLKGCQNCSHKE